MESDMYPIPVISQLSLNRINFIIWDRELKSLDKSVNQAISQYGAPEVGVYIVAFDEIAPIFIQPRSPFYSFGSKVVWQRWFRFKQQPDKEYGSCQLCTQNEFC